MTRGRRACGALTYAMLPPPPGAWVWYSVTTRGGSPPSRRACLASQTGSALQRTQHNTTEATRHATSPRPAAPARRRCQPWWRAPGALVDEVPEVFTKDDAARALSAPTDRSSLFRVLQELQASGWLKLDRAGQGTFPTAYPQTRRAKGDTNRSPETIATAPGDAAETTGDTARTSGDAPEITADAPVASRPSAKVSRPVATSSQHHEMRCCNAGAALWSLAATQCNTKKAS